MKLPLWGLTGSRVPEVVTFNGLTDGREHLAVVWPGEPAATTLVRIHSECLTGDVLDSARCDCGPQLHEAIRLFPRVGGILLYLRQEGRGIGLYNKIDAYALQEQGLDTVEANLELGLPADLRTYEVAGQMLGALGVDRVSLLTNNPQKVAALVAFGIRVEQRVQTGHYSNPHNARYLATKIGRMEHFDGQRLSVRVGEGGAQR